MKLLVLASLLALAFAKHEEYIGWKSYYVGVSDADFNTFGSMIDKYELDILSHPISGREGVILVKPEHQAGFEQDAAAAGISVKVHREDVKKELDYDDMMLERHNRESFVRNGGRNLPYDSYQQIEAINNYIDYIGATYPNVAKVVNAANSFEGRPIKYLKISTTNFEDLSKPVIVIDGGIHAREWISPPTVTYAINKLVEDVTEPDLLNRFDWILLPVVNPDGYKFTFTNSRFWRKTRSTDQSSLSGFCPGVDGNRNFDFHFGTTGTSSSACSDIYPGSKAFSEVETRVVRDIIQENLARIALYLTMHSFGSMILYPWGHNGSFSHNAFGLHVVAVEMANAIDKESLPNFPRYIVGNSALVLNYGASGAAEDYAHSVGVPLSYTYELPGLSGGMQGFNLSPVHIQQVVRETWVGITAGARRAGDLFRQQ
ncbi:unnamed protein product [Chrysodeixis includens]|uniref:Peptidase M14 domain-containing protein n=1 Tax=Chrysodeixis includens TaxID=689277 RepID=A0A9P0FSB2_CHRIL|nr:unnamed protein product [Chrysodeixis includens]